MNGNTAAAMITAAAAACRHVCPHAHTHTHTLALLLLLLLLRVVGKRRREAFDFLGGDVIKAQLANGVSRRRVGFVSSGAPARQHSEIKSVDGEVIGEITSGGFSPNLKKNIAMG